jgi:hypothetical protein
VIGYRISRTELCDDITAENPKWLTRAVERTAVFTKAKKYAEKSSIWADVKAVYMRIQFEKCIYCERKLESEALGKIEQDVEHFRPKSSVRAFVPSAALTGLGVSVSPVPSGATGYYSLPYEVFNYSAACKPCNSTLKSDQFPIAGTYDFAGTSPKAMLKEKPLLIYPIGDFDADPESLIRFHGTSPQPVKSKGFGRHRALTTIEFFHLDDVLGRQNLFYGRAISIIALFPQLEAVAKGVNIEKAQRVIDGFTNDRAPHANCARSYVALYHRDRVEAAKMFEAAGDLIASHS